MTKLLHRRDAEAHREDAIECSEDFELEAAQAYRTMTGMDEPLEDRARRAQFNARRTPLTRKTW